MLYNFVRDFWSLLLTLRWVGVATSLQLSHTPQFCRHSYQLGGFSILYWIIVILWYVHHLYTPLCGVCYVICTPHSVVCVMSFVHPTMWTCMFLFISVFVTV